MQAPGHDPSPAESDTVILRDAGLALSGGGFRATLFHLGVIKYLHDIGKLREISRVCSVSGGSIIAAHLVLEWRLANENFEAFAIPLLKFVQSDVRGRILRRWPLISIVNWIPGLRWLTSTYLLERLYTRGLYTKADGFAATLADLDAQRKLGAPSLHVLATSLSYPDGAAAFSESGFINLDEKRGSKSVITGRPHVGLAVAASSAVPGLFPAIEIDARRLKVRERDLVYPRQFLTDGGVYDNQGIEPLRMISRDSLGRLLIISDAGARADYSPHRTYRRMIRSLARVVDILFERTSQLRAKVTEQYDSSGHRICSISIRDQLDDGPIQWFGRDVQRTLETIRTDLDIFSDVEIRALVLHGQLVAMKQLRTNFSLSPPEGYKPWDPLVPKNGADAANSDNGVIRPEMLDNGAKTRVRFFAKDRIFIVYALFLALVITLGWWGLSPKNYRVLFTSITDAPNIIDVSNPGFVVEKRSVLIDLRHELPLELNLRDRLRRSPSVQDYRLRVLKSESNPRFLAYEIVSQRQLNEVFCTSGHPHEVRYSRQEGKAGKGLENVWTILVDTKENLPNIPFDVSFRAIRYNAYQAKNRNWVGVKVEGAEKLVETRVLLPFGKQLKGVPELTVREVWGTNETAYVGPVKIVTAGDSFTWTLENPERKMTYKAYIDWGD